MRMKVVLWALVIGLAIGGYVSGATLLKGWAQNAFSQACQRKVTIQAVRISFPAGIRFTGVTVPARAHEEIPFSLEEASLRISFSEMLKGRPGLELELVGPALSMERSPEGILSPPLTLGSPGAGTAKGQPLPLVALKIRKGRLTFLDRSVAPEVTWIFRDVGITLGSGAERGAYAFSAAASIEGGSQGPLGTLHVNGQFLPAQTAEAKVLIRIDKLEILAPYIRGVLGTAPSRGSCELASDVSFQQGMILTDNKLTVTQLFFPTEEPTVLGPTGNKLVALLKDQEGVIHLSFHVGGKLGERLDWSNLMTAALQEAMRQALTRSIQRTLTDVEQVPLEKLLRKGLESLGK